MVRGHPRCYLFCQVCRADCVCGTCNCCHTCLPNRGLDVESSPGESVRPCEHYDRSHNCDLGDTQNSQRGPTTETKTHMLQLEEYLSSPVFTLIVGPEQKEVHIHAQLLRNTAIYFQGLTGLGMDMAESQEKSVVMDDEIDNPDAFRIFSQYCYGQEYYFDEEKHSDQLHLHAKVYILAEKLQCMGLKALSLQKASKVCFTLGPSSNLANLKDTILKIYKNTHDVNSGKFPLGNQYRWPDSDGVEREGFRILLAKFWATHLVELRKQQVCADLYQECPEFLADLVLFVEPGTPPLI